MVLENKTFGGEKYFSTEGEMVISLKFFYFTLSRLKKVEMIFLFAEMNSGDLFSRVCNAVIVNLIRTDTKCVRGAIHNEGKLALN